MGISDYFKSKRRLIEENEKLKEIVERNTTLLEASCITSEALSDTDMAKEWHKADIRGQINRKFMAKYGKLIEYRLEKLPDGRVKIHGGLRI